MATIAYGSIIVLIAIYLVMAVGITRLIARSEYFDARQKMFQYLIVWLIPILGAAFVAAVLGPDIARRRQRGFISLVEAIILSAVGASVQETIETTLDAETGSSPAHPDGLGDGHG